MANGIGAREANGKFGHGGTQIDKHNIHHRQAPRRPACMSEYKIPVCAPRNWAFRMSELLASQDGRCNFDQFRFHFLHPCRLNPQNHAELVGKAGERAKPSQFDTKCSDQSSQNVDLRWLAGWLAKSSECMLPTLPPHELGSRQLSQSIHHHPQPHPQHDPL